MAILDSTTTILDTVTLTGSYVASAIKLGHRSYNYLTLYCDFDPANSSGGTSADLLIEASPDGTNWYVIAPAAPTGYALQSDGSLRFTYSGTGAQKGNAIVLKDLAHKNLRFSAKENGATNFGTVKVVAVQSLIGR